MRHVFKIKQVNNIIKQTYELKEAYGRLNHAYIFTSHKQLYHA